jgi:hypothetical protein
LSEISNGAERIARCPVLPRPSTHGTSPVGIAWLYESPAAPDLHLMILELPANQGVVLWRARFTGSHSSFKLVLYIIPVTPLSSRYEMFFELWGFKHGLGVYEEEGWRCW